MVRVLLLAIVLLSSCDTFDMRGFVAPTGDVVDNRFEQSMSLNGGKAVATIEADETYTFYVCTDPHIDDTYINMREFSTRLRNSSTARFGIMLGDCIDRRNVLPSYIEAIEYVEGLQTANLPIFSLIGNHELYFDGWEDYVELLGASVYWFEVKFDTGRDLFISLDSASGTLGKKQMKWLMHALNVMTSMTTGEAKKRKSKKYISKIGRK